MDVQIRFAETDEERKAVFRLRYETYVEEMGFIYPDADHQGRYLAEGSVKNARLVYARLGNETIGTLRIQWGGDRAFTEEDEVVYDMKRFLPVVPYNQMAILSRFMVPAGYRSTDVALRLLQTMLEFYLDHDVQLAFLDCRPHLINLYESLGYRPYAKSFNDSIAGLLVPLVMVMADVSYLKQINSPFLQQIQSRSLASDIPERVTPLLPQVTSIQRVSQIANSLEWLSLFSKLNEKMEDKINIFEGFNEEEKNSLLQKSYLFQCAKGDRIITQGNVDRTVFILLQGKLEVRIGDQVIAVETPVSVVGEVAFLLASSRKASVFAATDDVSLLSIREKALKDLMDSQPHLAARLLYNLSRILAVKLVAGNE